MHRQSLRERGTVSVGPDHRDHDAHLPPHHIAPAPPSRQNSNSGLRRDRDVDTGQSSGAVGTFDTVLLVPGSDPDGGPSGVGPTSEIPQTLRDMVQGGQVAYQYTSVPTGKGGSEPALIIGSPTNSSVPGLELYLVFPLTN